MQQKRHHTQEKTQQSTFQIFTKQVCVHIQELYKTSMLSCNHPRTRVHTQAYAHAIRHTHTHLVQPLQIPAALTPDTQIQSKRMKQKQGRWSSSIQGTVTARGCLADDTHVQDEIFFKHEVAPCSPCSKPLQMTNLIFIIIYYHYQSHLSLYLIIYVYTLCSLLAFIWRAFPPSLFCCPPGYCSHSSPFIFTFVAVCSSGRSIGADPVTYRTGLEQDPTMVSLVRGLIQIAARLLNFDELW